VVELTADDLRRAVKAVVRVVPDRFLFAGVANVEVSGYLVAEPARRRGPRSCGCSVLRW